MPSKTTTKRISAEVLKLRANADRIDSASAGLRDSYDQVEEMRRSHFGCLTMESGLKGKHSELGADGVEECLCYLRLAVGVLDRTFSQLEAEWAEATVAIPAKGGVQ